MKNSSLSLISALYNSEGNADLYKEIYYPIIRYSTIELYRKSDPNSSHYYALSDLNKLICELFDINIPTLVLGHAVQLMGRGNGLAFEYFKETTSFRILDVNEDISNDDIVEKANDIDGQLNELECKFKIFLQTEQLDCEKSFFDFFNDNEKAIASYINYSHDMELINEDYVNLTRFIQWAIENDKHTYKLIKKVLWGSIIAGFLQRKNDAIGVNVRSDVTYYIDTSLIFALLGYDTIDNVNYARELIREIHESGATPTIHVLTQEEVKKILTTIESQGAPDPTTTLGEAFYRDKKSMSDLLHIRNDLFNILTKHYNISYPQENRNVVCELKSKYQKCPEIQILQEKWKRKKTDDDFREIHDVALCSIVNNKNKYKTNIESYDCYFVTRNMDLIEMFGKKMTPSAILHPGNVILNLWIHCAQSKNIQQMALTEIVTRCLAMNQTDTQRRLRIFEKYATKAGLTQKDFQGMYTELIRRSAKTIQSTNLIIENEQKDSVCIESQVAMIKSIAATAIESTNQRLNMQSELNEQIKLLSSQLEVLKETTQKKEEEFKALRNDLKSQQTILKNSNVNHEEECKRYNALCSLYVSYGRLKQIKENFAIEKEKYVSYRFFWCSYTFQWLFFILIVFSLTYIGVKYFISNEVPGLTWAIIIPIVSLILNFSVNKFKLYIFKSPIVGKAEIRDKQYKNWTLINRERIEDTEKELKKIEREIIQLGGNVDDF